MRFARFAALTAVASLALAGCGGASRSVGTAPTAALSADRSASVASTAGSTAAASSAPAAATTAAQGAGTTTPATAPPAVAGVPGGTTTATPAPPPPIHHWPIPFAASRRAEMAAYSRAHYGEDTYVLSHPKVIVEHYTETAGAQEAWNTFAVDVPDSEFHALPNTCAHFLVERNGRIDQLVALSIRCRHTVGLNWTAIGIENIGLSDAEILADPAQMAASLRLTRWLRCRYGIALHNVIGHNESLSSPYHRERVPAFQQQTHSDWNHADMNRYRARLARLPCTVA